MGVRNAYTRCCLAVTLIAICCACADARSWLQAPYGNDSFNSQMEFLKNATLECEDDVVPSAYTVQYWVLPDLQVLQNGENRTFNTFDGTAAWTVSENGSHMYITLVQEEHFGLYHCIVNTTSKIFVIKKGINYQGPYFGDLWPKYRMNLIIGGSAAGSLLVIVAAIALVYHFRVDNKGDNGRPTTPPAYNGQSPEDEGAAIDTQFTFANHGFDGDAVAIAKSESPYDNVYSSAPQQNVSTTSTEL